MLVTYHLGYDYTVLQTQKLTDVSYNGAGKGHPRTGHEGPEGSTGISICFL